MTFIDNIFLKIIILVINASDLHSFCILKSLLVGQGYGRGNHQFVNLAFESGKAVS